MLVRGVLQHPVLGRRPAQRRAQLTQLRDLEAPVLGERRGHRAFQASLDGLDLGDVARVRHGLTSTKEKRTVPDRPTGVCHAWKAPYEVLACAGALSGLRAIRQPDGLWQGRTVAQGAVDNRGQVGGRSSMLLPGALLS